MSAAPTLEIFTDGASRGNPGAAAFAYVITPASGEQIEEGGCLGKLTNNQAEYTALVKALEHALELGAEHRVILHSDSELLVKQMNGEYRVKNEELRGLFEEAQALRKQFTGGVLFRHVRRAENSRADALCNEALDGLREPMPRASMFTKPAPPVKVKATPAPTPRAQALQCLGAAKAAWQQGAAEPSIESVWEELAALLNSSRG